MKKIFTEAWTRALCKELRRSEEYRHAARNWEADLVLTVEADAAHVGTKQQGAYLNLWRGECREARVATAEDYKRSKYVVSAGPETWAGLFSGKGDLGAEGQPRTTQTRDARSIDLRVEDETNT